MATSTFAAADGDGYEVQMGRWSRRRAPLLIDFSGITAAERVPDVGCGTGSLAFALVDAVYLAGDPDGPRSYTSTAWALKGSVA